MFNKQFTNQGQGYFLGTRLLIRGLNFSRIFLFLQGFCPQFWTYKRCRLNAIPFSTRNNTATFSLIPHIIKYNSRFKNTFHQFWGYSSFNFEYLSLVFLDFVDVRLQSCLSTVVFQRMSQNFYILLIRPFHGVC